MDIPVYYYNSFNGVLFLKVSCRDGHIVKIAKSHGSVDFSVMTGRTNRTKCIVQLGLHNLAGCL